ncbi:putative copper resistance protein D [Micrococcales bacterium KH10]|nr:putative copper resistance protein D [Micrococcales bacterium KH10]
MRTFANTYRYAVLAAAALVAIAAALVLGKLTGALDPVALLDAGAMSRYTLPTATVVAELASALTLGGLLIAAGIAPEGKAIRAGLVLAGISGGVWTIAALARAIASASVAMGVSVTSPEFGAGIEMYVTQVEGGRALAMVPILAAVVTIVAMGSSTSTGAAWAAVGVVGAFAVQSSAGHSASAGNHMLAISAIFVHMAGAALWIGTLGAIIVLWVRGSLDRSQLSAAITRYSPVALWAAVIVAISGLAAAIVNVGSLEGMRSGYGALIIVKAAIFAVLVGFGAAQRRIVIRNITDRAAKTSVTRNFWRLSAVELLTMGAISGVAVALSSTAPPAEESIGRPVTAAFLVTGHELPPEPTLANYFTQWNPDVLFAIAALAGVVTYVRWVVRLRSRGDQWPIWRTASWVGAMVVFAYTTNGGLALYGHVLFSAHMLQHMVLAMIVPLLVVSAAPATLALRALPHRSDGSRGPREWLLTLLHSRWAQFFSHPIVAAINFAGSMIVFYFTPAFEWALRTPAGHVAMVLHFSLAGYLFANALVGIDPGGKRPAYPMRLVLLLATMAFHAFFGVSIMSSESLLVANWFGWLGREWGPSALADQRTGGEIAWGIGEIPTILLAIIVAVRWTKDDERIAKRQDRRADRDGDAELAEYNQMLAKMAERDD